MVQIGQLVCAPDFGAELPCARLDRLLDVGMRNDQRIELEQSTRARPVETRLSPATASSPLRCSIVILHHFIIVNINGDSDRLKDKRKAGLIAKRDKPSDERTLESSAERSLPAIGTAVVFFGGWGISATAALLDLASSDPRRVIPACAWWLFLLDCLTGRVIACQASHLHGCLTGNF